MVKQPSNKLKVLLAFLLLVAVLVSTAACSSDKKEAKKVLNIGAEQEPDCLDFIGTCSGSSWGFWMVAVQTLPRAYAIEAGRDKDTWVTVPTDLLASEPVLETDPVQKITYEINPDAVWSDGVKITGADFEYTWDQIANTEDVYDPAGYTGIESVVTDKEDDHKVVVTYKNGEVYAGWQSLFGGNYGIFPSHILKGKDRSAEMKDGYTFSGGPFKLKKWTKGEGITLVPNDKYWGEKPKVNEVRFKFITDTVAEFKSFKAGEVSAIYPQPSFDVIDAIESGNGLEGATAKANSITGGVEAMWINNEAAPFDSVEVRQALGYSVDRDAIVKAIFGGLKIDKAVNSFVAPVLNEYADEEGTSMYVPDVAKANSLLAGKGWKKNSDGKYVKGGKLLEVQLVTTEGNERRKIMMEAIQKQLNDLGWTVTLKSIPAGELFGDDVLPKGNYQVGIYAQQLTVLDPTNCNLFCSEFIPTEANGGKGNNWTRTNNKEANIFLKQVDSELDVDKRIQASKSAEKELAKIATSLPLDPLPTVLITKNKIGGTIEDNPIMGPFYTMNTWTVKK